MNNYSDKDREEVLRRSNDSAYRQEPLNLGFGYTIYDILRMGLESLGKIQEMLEDIRDVVQERNNQND